MTRSRSLRSRVARFAQLERDERIAALTALALLPPLALALHGLGMARAQRLGSLLAHAAPPLDRRLPARRVAALVDAAAASLSDSRVPRVTCLVRSLAVCALLERRGDRPMLHFGVPRDVRSRERFEAHAWVELDGETLGDAASVDERYARFARIEGAARAEPPISVST